MNKTATLQTSIGGASASLRAASTPTRSGTTLSMGCNHCLDADCLKGCPVDAYTKDPMTGIVLHSADACIGCQYCVWNCPYQVPQFNAERGVVGKCDMCHGRLMDGREPACVNACPEAAIQIEIVDKVAWRIDYATAESPGMPPAEHTISTTRITLPKTPADGLERVDTGRVRQEHAHWSLVVMTTLIQAIVGTLMFLPPGGRRNPVALVCAADRNRARVESVFAPFGASGVRLARREDVETFVAQPGSVALRAFFRFSLRRCGHRCTTLLVEVDKSPVCASGRVTHSHLDDDGLRYRRHPSQRFYLSHCCAAGVEQNPYSVRFFLERCAPGYGVCSGVDPRCRARLRILIFW